MNVGSVPTRGRTVVCFWQWEDTLRLVTAGAIGSWIGDPNWPQFIWAGLLFVTLVVLTHQRGFGQHARRHFDGDGPATASPTSDVEIQQPMSQIDGQVTQNLGEERRSDG